MQVNFDSRCLLATRNGVILCIEEVWQQVPSEYPRKLHKSISRRLSAVQSMCGCPQRISNATLERLFIVNYLIVLNLQAAVH